RQRAFWIGWLSGLVGFTGIMAWVVTAMTTYGKVPEPVSYAILLLLATYLGLYVGLYCLAVVWLRELIPRYGIFFAPCFWVALEWFRTHLLSGRPYGCLRHFLPHRPGKCSLRRAILVDHAVFSRISPGPASVGIAHHRGRVHGALMVLQFSSPEC